jgi:hypothetical protein
MQIAIKYLQFEDSDMGFTDKEIMEFKPSVSAIARLEKLVPRLHIAQRHLDVLNLQKVRWWKNISAKTAYLSQDYVTKGRLTSYDRSQIMAMPDPASKEGKALTVKVHKVDEAVSEWMGEWEEEVGNAMVRHVSISQRCMLESKETGWMNIEKKWANELANVIMNEKTMVQRFIEEMGYMFQ